MAVFEREFGAEVKADAATDGRGRYGGEEAEAGAQFSVDTAEGASA